ncbi:nuclear transport factor 2 family protein [Subtercola lobariae]|uniref:SnoaL-like domain-containing protein n=1 Tax=Subtercola lobariae TaxID=1588641 RepID=A0A917F4J9_9MICO|nr:nuclear transport factor 2 family protein [Subtercola lobariae]GGF42058.1 hypothetical protein GCM10011399_38400 [Subtercola lobariae]
MSTRMTAEEVVRAWNDCYTTHDIDGALAYMSEDFQRFGDSTNWAPTGKQAWGDQMKGFMVAFPDWTWDLNSIHAVNENLVVCEFLEYGTWTADFELAPGLVLPATGERYEDHNGDWITVNDDGLISEIRAYITTNFDRTFHLESKLTALMGGGQ